MVLADTSIWVDHLMNNNIILSELLNKGQVGCHPFIIGELACGSLKNRSVILTLMQALPELQVIDIDDIIYFINKKNLYSRGLGFVDIQLLASAIIGRCSLWTKDKRLDIAAHELDISFRSKYE